MGIFNRFPYSSTHEMNLDFMLGKAQEINEQLQTVQTGMQDVQTGLSQIDEQTERATTAAAAAEAARDESQQNERDAFAWTEQAEQHADRAEAALSQMTDDADRAEAAANAASISASAASNSANIASQNAATAAQQAANAQLSAQSAQGALNQATVAAHNAQTSAVSAADAAALASGYNSQAATSATNAATSATNAATSATSVLGVEQNVQDLVESIPEDYSTLSNDVNDLKSAIYYGYDTFEQGTISATGVDTASDKYIRAQYIPIDVFSEMQTAGLYNTKYFVYNADKSFIASPGWITVQQTLSVSQVRQQYPNTAYIRFIIANKTSSVIIPDDFSNSGIDIYIVLPQNNKVQIDYINGELTNILESDYTGWETGNIYNDGTDTALPQRLRTDYINIENLISFRSAETINWRCFAYNANHQFLGYKGWYTATSSITKDDIINDYPLCAYVRFLVSSKDESALSPADVDDLDIELLVYRIGTIESQIGLINSDLLLKQEEINTLNANVFMPDTEQYYYGKRVDLKNNTFQMTETIHPRGSGQACACFGDYVFAFNATTGKCNIFKQPNNISTPVATVDMPLVNGVIPHFNAAVFGDTISDQSLPLLYITVTTSLDADCICAVYQFAETNGTWSVSLVHTVTVGFYNDDIWGARSSYDMGTFFIHNGSLWVFGTSKTNKRTRFFELPLPDHTANVTISESQIKTFFDTQYISCTQDVEYLNGILYISAGMGSTDYPTFIITVNMYTQNVDSFIPLNAYWTHEIEFIYNYGSNLWFGTINAIKMDF